MKSDMSTNTHRSFADKWTNNPSLAFEETLKPSSDIHSWIMNRNGFSERLDFEDFIKNKRRMLDAGCGNGRVTALLSESSDPRAQVIGIDFSSYRIAQQNLKDFPNVEILEKDLLDDLSDLGKFDFIYCQEVLHHTENPKLAFSNLCRLLEESGEIAIYVYKKKAPIREFVDDFIRQKIADLSYQDALEESSKITELGKILSEMNVEIDVPEIQLLDIPKGTYSIQRFIYHFFMKCFWNENLNFEENAAINYDWYHPQLCSRHTLEEIRDWFHEEGLQIEHEYVDFYGITMHGKRV